MTAAQEKNRDISTQCPVDRSLRPCCKCGNFPLQEGICPSREESTKAQLAPVFLEPEPRLLTRSSRAEQQQAKQELPAAGSCPNPAGEEQEVWKHGLLHPQIEQMGVWMCKKPECPRGTRATQCMWSDHRPARDPDVLDGHQEVKEAAARSAVPLPQAAVPAAQLTGQLFWGEDLFEVLVLTRNFILD